MKNLKFALACFFVVFYLGGAFVFFSVFNILLMGVGIESYMLFSGLVTIQVFIVIPFMARPVLKWLSLTD